MKHKIIVKLTSLLFLIAIWIALSENLPTIILPKPYEVAKQILDPAYLMDLFLNFVTSSTRIAIGLSIAILLAVPAGVLIGWNDVLNDFFELEIEFFRALPIVALIPLIIFILGIGDTSKIFVISFGCFWPILINTIQGVKSIDNIHIKVAKTMGADQFDIFFKIIMPASSPYIFTGIKVSLSISLILMVVSEMIAGNNGLGYMLVESVRTYNTERMMISLILIGVFGYILNRIFDFVVSRKILKWYYIDKRKQDGSE